MSNASQQEHTYYLLAQFIHFAYHHEEIDTGFRAYIRTNYGIDDEQVLTQLEQYASAASADYTLSPVSSKFFGRENIWYEPQSLFSGGIPIASSSKARCFHLADEAISHVKEYILTHQACLSFSTLLDLIEAYCTYFSVDNGKTSFFEFLKLRTGLRDIYSLLDLESEAPILVCSLDFIGIKEFKFQKLFNNDLNRMRVASLYIDLFRENVLDELLDRLGLTRANVIYSGGRHLHLYLPNTTFVKASVSSFVTIVNDWLVAEFGTLLYLSYGYCPFTHGGSDANHYRTAFVHIANFKSVVESRKYTPENIRAINALHSSGMYLKKRERFLNSIDSLVSKLSNDENVRFIVSLKATDIEVFPGRFIDVLPCSSTWEKADSLVRMYLRKCPERQYDEPSIGIWLSPYAMTAGFEALKSKGKPNRPIGVLRFDIDNFKSSMLSDISPSGSENIKMMLSKEFTLFLRYYIHLLYSNEVYMIHEGADDAFFVGSWDDIVRFAYALQSSCKEYTGGVVTMSVGISCYTSGSFSSAASEAQELLDRAKLIPGKDAVALATTKGAIKWDDFQLSYLDELSMET